MKFSFEVYCKRHKTVEIEADSIDAAYETLGDQLYDVDMDDAEEMGDRRWELISEEGK